MLAAKLGLVHFAQKVVAHGVALNGNKAGIRHFPDLLRGQLVFFSDVVYNYKNCRLYLVFLQDREELRIVVVIAVVEGQYYGFFDFLNMIQILEGDGRIARVQQGLDFFLQSGGGNKQLRLSPEIVAHGVVHQDRNSIPRRNGVVLHDMGVPALILLRVYQLRQTQRGKQFPRRSVPDTAAGQHRRGQQKRLFRAFDGGRSLPEAELPAPNGQHPRIRFRLKTASCGVRHIRQLQTKAALRQKIGRKPRAVHPQQRFADFGPGGRQILCLVDPEC